jgi:hypothetical protein
MQSPYVNDSALSHYEFRAYLFDRFPRIKDCEAFAPRTQQGDGFTRPNATAPIRLLHDLIAKSAQFIATRVTDEKQLDAQSNFALGLVMSADVMTSHAHASGFGTDSLRDEWMRAARALFADAERAAAERIGGAA